jgi:hypothetical protein
MVSAVIEQVDVGILKVERNAGIPRTNIPRGLCRLSFTYNSDTETGYKLVASPPL